MTECTRCGDCCVDIWSVGPDRLAQVLAIVPPLVPNPVLAANQASALFMLAHWELQEVRGQHARYSCDAFDPASRLCTAQQARPPVCSGFPWYGKAPRASISLSPRCNYNRDLRTALPVVAINGRSTT